MDRIRCETRTHNVNVAVFFPESEEWGRKWSQSRCQLVMQTLRWKTVARRKPMNKNVFTTGKGSTDSLVKSHGNHFPVRTSLGRLPKRRRSTSAATSRRRQTRGVRVYRQDFPRLAIQTGGFDEAHWLEQKKKESAAATAACFRSDAAGTCVIAHVRGQGRVQGQYSWRVRLLLSLPRTGAAGFVIKA